MARLYSDLLDSANRRYYFGLDSAPGGISPATAGLRISGFAPTIQEQLQVFRTPQTAVLTLTSLAPGAEPHLQPATAALSMSSLVPGLQSSKVITPALNTDYTDYPDNAPTVLTIMAVVPTTGLIQITNLSLNVSQGGNIVIISPVTGAVTIAGPAPNLPRAIGAGALSIAGLAPLIITQLVVEPSTGTLTISGSAPAIDRPFEWIDDQPVNNSTWIDDPRA